MEIEVLLFASLRDRAGRGSVSVEVESDATVADLRSELARRHPELSDGLSASRIAIDQQFAGEDEIVPAGVEVAAIPPVSGG